MKTILRFESTIKGNGVKDGVVYDFNQLDKILTSNAKVASSINGLKSSVKKMFSAFGALSIKFHAKNGLFITELVIVLRSDLDEGKIEYFNELKNQLLSCLAKIKVAVEHGKAYRIATVASDDDIVDIIVESAELKSTLESVASLKQKGFQTKFFDEALHQRNDQFFAVTEEVLRTSSHIVGKIDEASGTKGGIVVVEANGSRQKLSVDQEQLLGLRQFMFDGTILEFDCKHISGITLLTKFKHCEGGQKPLRLSA
jgi:hypothetical protein